MTATDAIVRSTHGDRATTGRTVHRSEHTITEW